MGISPSASPRFCEVYTRHVDSIRRYCYRRLARSEVDDATAEVFLVAWRRVDQMPGGDDALFWLFGIARNVVRNHNRSRFRRNRLQSRLAQSGSTPSHDVAVQVIRRIEHQEVLDALAALRPRDREILRLAAWEGLKPAAIARVLGIEPHAASMRLQRARHRLGAVLEICDDQPGVAAIPSPLSEGGER